MKYHINNYKESKTLLSILMHFYITNRWPFLYNILSILEWVKYLNAIYIFYVNNLS